MGIPRSLIPSEISNKDQKVLSFLCNLMSHTETALMQEHDLPAHESRSPKFIDISNI